MVEKSNSVALICGISIKLCVSYPAMAMMQLAHFCWLQHAYMVYLQCFCNFLLLLFIYLLILFDTRCFIASVVWSMYLVGKTLKFFSDMLAAMSTTVIKGWSMVSLPHFSGWSAWQQTFFPQSVYNIQLVLL